MAMAKLPPLNLPDLAAAQNVANGPKATDIASQPMLAFEPIATVSGPRFETALSG